MAETNKQTTPGALTAPKTFAWPTEDIPIYAKNKAGQWVLDPEREASQPSKASDLFQLLGAYRFIIRYVNHFDQSLAAAGKEKDYNTILMSTVKTIGDWSGDTAAKLGEFGADAVKFLGGSAGAQSTTEDITTKVVGYAAFAAGSGMAMSALNLQQNAMNAGQILTTSSANDRKTEAELSKERYDGQAENVAEIWLPMHEYKLSRQTGIMPSSGAGMRSVFTGMMKKAVEYGNSELGKAGATGTKEILLNTAGLSMSENLGYKVQNVNFETIDLSWTLYPRTAEEMFNIQNIIKYFSFASLPVYQKSGGDLGRQMFYRLPPYIQMEALTTDNVTNPKKPIIRKLKPLFNYYLTEFRCEAGNSDKGVMISPHGFPIPCKISIKLSKMDYTSQADLEANAEDIWDLQYAEYLTQDKEESSTKLNNVGTSADAKAAREKGIEYTGYYPFG